MEIPKQIKKLYDLANLYIEKRKFNKALSLLKEILEKFPDYAEVLSLLGYVHFKLKFKKLSKEEVFALTQNALSFLQTSLPKPCTCFKSRFFLFRKRIKNLLILVFWLLKYFCIYTRYYSISPINLPVLIGVLNITAYILKPLSTNLYAVV